MINRWSGQLRGTACLTKLSPAWFLPLMGRIYRSRLRPINYPNKTETRVRRQPAKSRAYCVKTPACLPGYITRWPKTKRSKTAGGKCQHRKPGGICPTMSKPRLWRLCAMRSWPPTPSYRIATMRSKPNGLVLRQCRSGIETLLCQLKMTSWSIGPQRKIWCCPPMPNFRQRWPRLPNSFLPKAGSMRRLSQVRHPAPSRIRPSPPYIPMLCSTTWASRMM